MSSLPCVAIVLLFSLLYSIAIDEHATFNYSFVGILFLQFEAITNYNVTITIF